MRQAGFLSFLICAGFAAGISLGYGIYHELPDRVLVYSTLGSITENALPTKFGFVNVRGTIMAIDASKETLLLDAISPYESGEHIVLSVTFDAATRIGPLQPNDQTQQLGSLTVGTPVSLFIKRTSGALYAQQIRFGAGTL